MYTNDFLQMFRAQEVAKQAETVGLMYAAMIGGLAGMAPLIYGSVKNRLGVGLLGFILCIIAGYFGSLFFAGPIAAVFVGWIVSLHREDTKAIARKISYTSTTAPKYPQRNPQTIISSMSTQQFERIGQTRIRFLGSGSLLKMSGGNWQFLGSLPQEVELPDDEKTAYKIRSFSGDEFIDYFTKLSQLPADYILQAEHSSKDRPTDAPIDNLSKLKTLKDSGDITSEEFERLKRHIFESVPE